MILPMKHENTIVMVPVVFSYLPNECTKEVDEPTGEEWCRCGIQSNTPVNDDVVGGGQDENEGSFTENLAQVVGREVVGAP